MVFFLNWIFKSRAKEGWSTTLKNQIYLYNLVPEVAKEIVEQIKWILSSELLSLLYT